MDKRPLEEISKDYSGLCMKAGDLQYKIKCFNEELAATNEEMRKLNLEAAEASAPPKQDGAEL